MKRITFAAPDDLNALLEDERRRRDVPASKVIREALARYLAGDEQARRLSFIGLGRSGFHDTARSIDTILAEDWGGDRRR